jgi:hypothetical protein
MKDTLYIICKEYGFEFIGYGLEQMRKSRGTSIEPWRNHVL